MVFAEPDSISSGGENEELEMDVLSVSLFKDAATLKGLGPSSFADGESIIPKKIPPQTTDKEMVKQIDDSIETGGQIADSLSGGNIVIAILVGATMQQLWGLVRNIQLVIFAGLIRTPLPAHTFIFFVQAMNFA